ncbi:MAG: histidine phosphatase family protein [Anaeromyxobacter sp.]|nr:histidine phosphatase family protein [Anaeromyxobacter sp.]MBL0275311.1 histidine phosphatase family protein [Anaeromyxobacter sp.]
MAARFHLVRHAHAEAAAAGGDAARRLTPQGRAAFAAAARRLAGRLPLTRIVTSPFARARETAALLSTATGAPVEEDPRLASGTSTGRELLALGAALGPGVALVGHNPEVAEALALAGLSPAEVPPGTVAALDERGGLLWVERG